MRRGAVVTIVAALVAVGPAAAAKSTNIASKTNVKDEISAAYARLVDRSLPVRERLAALEDGERLRRTLERVDDLRTIARIRASSVQLFVHSVRVHQDSAEVQLTVFADMYMVTGWTGVARKVDGHWVVARGTFCTLIMEWTDVRCPGGPRGYAASRSHRIEATRRNGDATMALTFADGARADLVVPSDVSTGWTVLPHAQVVVDGKGVPVFFGDGPTRAQQPVLTYKGAPGRAPVVLDAMQGLLVPIGRWTAFIQAESLSEHERRLIARHLDGYTTKSGFPVLTPTAPLHFRPSARPTALESRVTLVKSPFDVDYGANPIELWFSNGDQLSATVVLTPGPCPGELQKPVVDGGYRAEERCTADFGRIAIAGDSSTAGRLLDTLRVVDYRPPPTSQTA